MKGAAAASTHLCMATNVYQNGPISIRTAERLMQVGQAGPPRTPNRRSSKWPANERTIDRPGGARRRAERPGGCGLPSGRIRGTAVRSCYLPPARLAGHGGVASSGGGRRCHEASGGSAGGERCRRNARRRAPPPGLTKPAAGGQAAGPRWPKAGNRSGALRTDGGFPQHGAPSGRLPAAPSWPASAPETEPGNGPSAH